MQSQKAYCHNEEISLSTFLFRLSSRMILWKSLVACNQLLCITSVRNYIVYYIFYFYFFYCTLHSTVTFLSSFSLFLSWSTCAFITGAWSGYALPVQFSSRLYLRTRKSPYMRHPVLQKFPQRCLWISSSVCMTDWIVFLSYCSVVYIIHMQAEQTLFCASFVFFKMIAIESIWRMSLGKKTCALYFVNEGYFCWKWYACVWWDSTCQKSFVLCNCT